MEWQASCWRLRPSPMAASDTMSAEQVFQVRTNDSIDTRAPEMADIRGVVDRVCIDAKRPRAHPTRGSNAEIDCEKDRQGRDAVDLESVDVAASGYTVRSERDVVSGSSATV